MIEPLEVITEKEIKNTILRAAFDPGPTSLCELRKFTRKSIPVSRRKRCPKTAPILRWCHTRIPGEKHTCSNQYLILCGELFSEKISAFIDGDFNARVDVGFTGFSRYQMPPGV